MSFDISIILHHLDIFIHWHCVMLVVSLDGFCYWWGSHLKILNEQCTSAKIGTLEMWIWIVLDVCKATKMNLILWCAGSVISCFRVAICNTNHHCCYTNLTFSAIKNWHFLLCKIDICSHFAIQQYFFPHGVSCRCWWW